METSGWGNPGGNTLGRGPIWGILCLVKLRKNELVVGMCAAMETSRIQWYNL